MIMKNLSLWLKQKQIFANSVRKMNILKGKLADSWSCFTHKLNFVTFLRRLYDFASQVWILIYIISLK